MLGNVCSKCSDAAVYNRPYSGEHLCGRCFKRSLEEKVVRTISKFKMLNYGEKVLLMLSGGKDSLTMLRIMNNIVSSHASQIVAATIDEGIKGYREDAVEIAEEACSAIGVPHHIFSFKDLFGYSMDEIELLKDEESSCSICGILRRRAMDLIAQKLGLHVVATAHNLDDIAQTFLINLLNNDVKRLPWNLPLHNETELFNQRRIKPLAELYEEEVALYSFLNKERFQKISCPYMHEGIRSEIRDIINTLEKNHPGIKYSFFNSAVNVPSVMEMPKTEVHRCEGCGYPTFSNRCSVCITLDRLKNKRTKQVK
jgi:cytoplasmic tRNA 2-thiolation protein 1